MEITRTDNVIYPDTHSRQDRLSHILQELDKEARSQVQELLQTLRTATALASTIEGIPFKAGTVEEARSLTLILVGAIQRLEKNEDQIPSTEAQLTGKTR